MSNKLLVYLLICHGIQQDLALLHEHKKPYFMMDKSSPEIARYHMCKQIAGISPARAGTCMD